MTPVRTDSRASTRRRKLIFVVMPRQAVRARASLSDSMALTRSGAHEITLASIGSYVDPTTDPLTIPESTRVPVGGAHVRISPPVGRNPLSASSAYTRASTA